jgi:hypothetical protein
MRYTPDSEFQNGLSVVLTQHIGGRAATHTLLPRWVKLRHRVMSASRQLYPADSTDQRNTF